MAGAGSAAPLTIRVVDAFGHPCPGIEAEVLVGWQSQGRIMTDADGCLTVEAEPSDYGVAVKAYLISGAARQCDIGGWDGSPDVVDAPLERVLCVGFTRSGRPEGVGSVSVFQALHRRRNTAGPRGRVPVGTRR